MRTPLRGSDSTAVTFLIIFVRNYERAKIHLSESYISAEVVEIFTRLRADGTAEIVIRYSVLCCACWGGLQSGLDRFALLSHPMPQFCDLIGGHPQS